MGKVDSAVLAFLATLSREGRIYGAHYAHHRSENTMANVVMPAAALDVGVRGRRAIASAIDAIFEAGACGILKEDADTKAFADDFVARFGVPLAVK